MEQVTHLIGGERLTSHRTLEVSNPATGQMTRQLFCADSTTVEQTVAATKAAFPAWRDTPPAKRAQAHIAVSVPY